MSKPNVQLKTPTYSYVLPTQINFQGLKIFTWAQKFISYKFLSFVHCHFCPLSLWLLLNLNILGLWFFSSVKLGYLLSTINHNKSSSTFMVLFHPELEWWGYVSLCSSTSSPCSGNPALPNARTGVHHNTLLLYSQLFISNILKHLIWIKILHFVS